ncbi:hypothetical protein HELRODRAFT_110881 [Helobdella robusta]|uniref:Bromo domain-containing protein n=1 Tax=Helobdella robusta TaxID=6412 RepID=T1EF61_HELRO|nr:hypothetical protein HELRODRAFT_110881 [Helobdella robusta]ESO06808.1 hypothetical protein HELRODRAFT_110881 [Helobdella robusta]
MVMQSSSSNSSSSSEDTDTTGDGLEKFENKRMKKFLPMNLKVEDIMTSAFKDRAHVGSSMADVEPMNVDTSVTFKDVGGLDKILFSLKEMVILPLIYPEFFKSFKVNAPKGVLFYGPPGTGKTLVARALANEYSRGKSKIAFFMRKGADCLSKWVGESEKQLRILFDQAYQMRPSIIFFDEIDGLAPVRSSKQEQFHNSIVTTLLALMDGLDDRGEVIVIGSTNRIDSIDLAFRRPGRFDRELWFPLPSYEGRRDILKIYTSDWTPKLSDDVLHYLASNTIGYSGADLKYLCSEAALNALHGTYPQIFSTGDKLLIDTKEIQVSPKDFLTAMKTIVPSCDRSITPFAKMLPPFLKPLIGRQLQELSRQVTEKIFPKEKIKGLLSKFSRGPGATNEFEEVFDCDLPDINSRHSALVSLKSNSLLVCGRAGQGHTKYICPALLHLFDNLPVHVINLPALYGNEFKTPEESLVHIIKECKLHTPSILYLPNINHWWKEVSRSVLSILVSMVDELYHTVPVFVLGSCDVIDYDDHDPVPDVILNLFNHKREISTPTEEDREAFFQDLIFSIFDQPRIIKPSDRRRAKTSVPLLTAPPVELRKLSSLELEKLKVMEEKTLRELRLFLRDVINKLSRDRKFAIFSKPVDEDEVPDYYNIIHRPMDLSTMMSKIDLHKYHTVGHFLQDIDLIVSNALEYNPETDEADRSIRHRACALKDTAYWIIDSRLDEDFDKLCKDIYISKINRGSSAVLICCCNQFT